MSCPYAAYNTTLTTQSTYCGDQEYCIVGRACDRMPLETFVNSSSVFQMITHVDFVAGIPKEATSAIMDGFVNSVGDLTAANATELRFDNNDDLDLTKAVWPQSLRSLSLRNNSLKSLPSGIRYDMLENIYLDQNQLHSVEHVVFTNVIRLSINKMPALTVWNNVSLSGKLKYFGCDSCRFTSFNVDQLSYSHLLVLSKMTPQQNEVGIFVESINTTSSCFNGSLVNITMASQTLVLCLLGTKSQTNGFPSSITTGLIIAANFILVVSLLLYRYCVHKTKNRESFAPYCQFWEHDTIQSNLEENINSYLDELALWRMSESDVKLIHKIASGGYGQVWAGELNGKCVAVKFLHRSQRSAIDIAMFLNEVAITARLQCPYIIAFLGVVWTSPPDTRMLLEYMDSGDVREHLSRSKQPDDFSWELKLKCSASLVGAVLYLHSINILHRDIKAKNILVNTNMEFKLADIGVAVDELSGAAFGFGTSQWMAPEVLKGLSYTRSADIYSIGMVFFELNTHLLPFCDGSQLTRKIILSNSSPSCPVWFKELTLSCLSHDPEKRPTIDLLSLTLQEKMNKMCHDS
ncbi:kinase [Thraustotheca clavata]|uniref:Kinase n=1 Tax=Thraustotheca clavata TaxID=74557 RepID=A0A1V9ZXF2_9STRA|nr:kinase [Thraustotheca clavata]